MKKLVSIIVFSFSLWGIGGYAQTLSPKVTSTSGGYTTAGGISLSWTLGETFTATLTAGGKMISQGAQQPEIDLLTGTVNTTTFAGSNITVPYTATGYIDGANVFTAQLSNASGSFTPATAIGTATSTLSGTITATIPAATPPGSGYRIRVISGNPSRTAPDNGINITINPSAIEFIVTEHKDVTCNGLNNGRIKVAASGGTAPYKYTSAGSPNHAKGIFRQLYAGTYNFTVKDANGFTAYLTGIVVTEPAVMNIDADAAVKNACYGASDGSIMVNVTGGTPPYRYSLIGTRGNYKNSNKFKGLAPGTYTIYVKDANLCVASLSNIAVDENPELTGSITKQTSSVCAGTTGSVTVAGNGGSPVYKYSLTGDVNTYKPKGRFTGLAAGSYAVYVKDANGCVTTVPVTIVDDCSFAGTDGKSGGAYLLDAKVLPNPSETAFNLVLKGNSRDVVEIRVLDMYGKAVHRATGSANQFYRFGQSFAGGVYFVQILQGEHMKTIKVVKR